MIKHLCITLWKYWMQLTGSPICLLFVILTVKKSDLLLINLTKQELIELIALSTGHKSWYAWKYFSSLTAAFSACIRCLISSIVTLTQRVSQSLYSCIVETSWISNIWNCEPFLIGGWLGNGQTNQSEYHPASLSPSLPFTQPPFHPTFLNTGVLLFVNIFKLKRYVKIWGEPLYFDGLSSLSYFHQSRKDN